MVRLGLALALGMTLALTPSISTAQKAGSLERSLLEQSKQLARRGQFRQAVVLLEGAWELGNRPEVLLQLAERLRDSGRLEDAVDAYQKLLSVGPPPALAQKAKAEIQRLTTIPNPNPFRQERVRPRMTAQAKLAFKAGRKLVKQKKYEDAIRTLTAALVLDPDLPGTYRILGATYARIKAPQKELKFLQEYLRIRPDGRIARTVRKLLAKRGVLGTLRIRGSFVGNIWINGRAMGLRTPPSHKKKAYVEVTMPPGRHTVTYSNNTVHTVIRKAVRLKAKETKTIHFKLMVVVPKLEPWARIRADGRALGLWDAIGLPLKPTHSPVKTYHLSFIAHDASRRMDMDVVVKPGKTLKISKWP